MEDNLEKCRMGTRDIKDKEIIYILKNRRLLLDTIQRKMEHAYNNIESLDETIKRISPMAVRYDTDGRSARGAAGGLDGVLLKRDFEHKRQMEAHEEVLYELIKEEEKIHCVFQCLSMLPADDYELLDALYIKSETWECYASRNGISMSTLSRKKRKALGGVKNLYRGD